MELWVEKYRPANLQGYVFQNEDQKAIVEKWAKEGIPNVLLEGGPGMGKTTLAYVLLKELKVDDADILFINASRERKPEDLQDKIVNFVSTWPLGDYRYVILDECLSEDERIMMADGSSMLLGDMEPMTRYAVKSFNMETRAVEDDYAVVQSTKEDDLYTVLLQDGRTITATANHPFLVDDGKVIERQLKDLKAGDEIITMNGPSVIQAITHKGKGKVVNLTVLSNHTFITENGIPTHNCDSITPLAQRVLRGEIERYSDTARFILTANYANKILPALHSRFQTLTFSSLDKDEFLIRVGSVLMSENITFTEESLFHFVDLTYPDLRKCIGLIQQHSHSGVLTIPTEKVQTTRDYLHEVIRLFNVGRPTEGRKLLIGNSTPEEYPEIYRFFYDNLHLFTDDDAKQDELILVIADGLRIHDTVSLGDPEINLSATLVGMSNILRG